MFTIMLIIRLPSSTRFPPRGRQLSASTTTYVPEVSSETVRHRGRPQSDSVADESLSQTRSRTRAHIRYHIIIIKLNKTKSIQSVNILIFFLILWLFFQFQTP